MKYLLSILIFILSLNAIAFSGSAKYNQHGQKNQKVQTISKYILSTYMDFDVSEEDFERDFDFIPGLNINQSITHPVEFFKTNNDLSTGLKLKIDHKIWLRVLCLRL